jgi:hypothetical protein
VDEAVIADLHAAAHAEMELIAIENAHAVHVETIYYSEMYTRHVIRTVKVNPVQTPYTVYPVHRQCVVWRWGCMQCTVVCGGVALCPI